MQRHIKRGNVLQLIMSSLLLNSNVISNAGTRKKNGTLLSVLAFFCGSTKTTTTSFFSHLLCLICLYFFHLKLILAKC